MTCWWSGRFWETWSTVSLLLISLSSSQTRYLSQKISGSNCIYSLIFPLKRFCVTRNQNSSAYPTIQARLSNLVREKTFSWDVPQHRYCCLIIRLFIKINIFRLLGHVHCTCTLYNIVLQYIHTTYNTYILYIQLKHQDKHSQTVGSSCEHERCRLVHCNKALGGSTKLDRNPLVNNNDDIFAL